MLTEIKRSDRKTFMLKKSGTLFEKYIPMENVYAASKNIYWSKLCLMFPKIYSNWNIFVPIEHSYMF